MADLIKVSQLILSFAWNKNQLRTATGLQNEAGGAAFVEGGKFPHPPPDSRPSRFSLMTRESEGSSADTPGNSPGKLPGGKEPRGKLCGTKGSPPDHRRMKIILVTSRACPRMVEFRFSVEREGRSTTKNECMHACQSNVDCAYREGGFSHKPLPSQLPDNNATAAAAVVNFQCTVTVICVGARFSQNNM